MKQRETDIQRRVMLAIGSRPGIRLFRNNIGVAVYPDGSRVAYGLCPGSSDLVGFRSTVITPDMVGKKVAVFVAMEVKKPGKYAGKKQRNFLGVIAEAGGIAGTVKSVEEAEKLIKT